MGEDHVFNAKEELVWTKSIEMFAESIPCSVLQAVYIVLYGADAKTLASIVISAATTGFTSATITYDNDTDPSHRKKMPDQYGLMPDDASRRGVFFACMVLNSSALMLLRCMGTASCAVNPTAAQAYIGYYLADTAFFFLYKIVHKDLAFWFPTKGWLGVVMTFFARWMVKLVSDYTAVVHFRLPYDLGGW